jgi:transposase
LTDTELDLKPLRDTYHGRGSKPHAPELLLKLVLYEHMSGRPQPIQWHKDLRESLPVQWLTFGMHVSKTTLYEFRDRVEPLLSGWLAQIVRTAVSEGHTDAATGSLDGTYVAANASRHRTVTLETVERRLEQLEQAAGAPEEELPTTIPAAIPAVVPETTASDASPDDDSATDSAEAVADTHPATMAPPTASLPAAASSPPGWMSRTARGRKRQERRLRLARRVLQDRHVQNARRRKDKRKADRQIRVSLGDPQAALGRDKLDVFRPLYNVQVMTDVKTDLVLAYDVSSSISDSGQLVPMVDRTQAVTGRPLETVLVDSGYPSGPELAACDQRGVTVLAPWQENSFSEARAEADPKKQLLSKELFVWEPALRAYRCPQGKLLVYAKSIKKQKANGDYHPLEVYQPLAEDCAACPLRSRCTKSSKRTRQVQRQPDEAFIEQLKRRMQTPEAKSEYAQRGRTVERRFADLKGHRNFDRMSGQTPERARAQTGLTLLAHNLVTLDSLRTRRSHPPPVEIPVKPPP